MTRSLSPAERVERLRTDQRTIELLDSADCRIRVTGHRSSADARAGRDPVPPGDLNPPTDYRVTYEFDTLRARGVRHGPTVVHVAPLANGDYPRSSPTAWVISDVVPWTPHFAANVPICHGDHLWTPNRTLLVDYIIHIGKLLNFDEPPPIPSYHGYNGAAVAYWRDAMKFEPLNPDLRFPSIRAEDARRVGVFRPGKAAAPATDRFRPAGPAAPQANGRFRGAASPAPARKRFSPAGER
jgi:hypothetical protein